jgi:hypothetical protein
MKNDLSLSELLERYQVGDHSEETLSSICTLYTEMSPGKWVSWDEPVATLLNPKNSD